MSPAAVANPNIQTLDISLLSLIEQRDLIQDLRRAVLQVRQSKIECGRILLTLRDGTPHGKWEKLLEEVCSDIKISRATAHNYMTAYMEVQFFPPPIIDACRSAGLNLEAKPDRHAVARELAANPQATPEEIIQGVLDSKKGPKYTPLEQVWNQIIKLTPYSGDGVEHVFVEALNSCCEPGALNSESPREIDLVIYELELAAKGFQEAAQKLRHQYAAILEKERERIAQSKVMA